MWHDIRLLNICANALFALAVLALLAGGLWWLAQRPDFALKTIRVEQSEHVPMRYVSTSTIRHTALPRIEGNFFTTDLEEVKSAFEAVPWVRRASVRREWPATLVVTLEEHVPFATWGDDGRLVSVHGEVFTANLAEAEEDGELPALSGPGGSEREVVARFRDLGQWLAAVQLAPRILRLSERYAWTARLDNGMTVELGREQHGKTMQERVERLVSVYPQLRARLQERMESVDMRYPNGLALRASGLDIKEVKKK